MTAPALLQVLFPWRRPPATSAAHTSSEAERALRLRRLFDDTHDLAWRVLRRFVRKDRLEDCFQQVYLIASTKLDEIRPGCERSFVYGIAVRLARASRRQAWREIPEEEPDLRASFHLGADALLERRRLVEVCDHIVEKLKPDLREVFVLYEIEGLRGAEIAKLLEIPEGTAHSRLRRAREQVRAHVEALQDSVREVSRG